MAPKLYALLASPPVRAVLMCAKELGLDLQLVDVNLLEGEHMKEEYSKKNPQHTIPLLEDEDGFLLPDSHAIMGYLVAKYGKTDSLYPKNDIKAKAIIDHRLFFDDGILFSRGLSMSKPLIFKDLQPSQEKLDSYKEALQILDRILADNKTDFVAGNTLTIADFSVTATVTSYDIFVPHSSFPHLKAYIDRMEKLSCYKANIEGLKMLNELINSRLNN